MTSFSVVKICGSYHFVHFQEKFSLWQLFWLEMFNNLAHPFALWALIFISSRSRVKKWPNPYAFLNFRRIVNKFASKNLRKCGMDKRFDLIVFSIVFSIWWQWSFSLSFQIFRGGFSPARGIELWAWIHIWSRHLTSHLTNRWLYSILECTTWNMCNLGLPRTLYLP